MTKFSSNAIKALGKRLRDGTATEQDLDALDVYRREFDELLLQTAEAVSGILRINNVRHVLSGRTKRTKSIIRKLARERNNGMDLSRMSDIVGIRVILPCIRDQDQALQLLAQDVPIQREPKDYRGTGGYRAVHLIVGNAAKRVEIQLRTCAQHFWADESERLGERVKEGNATPVEAAYLAKLNEFCNSADYDPSSEGLQANPCFWDGYIHLVDQFDHVAKAATFHKPGSFVVVYHVPTNALIRLDAFLPSERAEALEHFSYLSRSLDETEYDILVLNTGTKSALSVTHPRYFPEKFD